MTSVTILAWIIFILNHFAFIYLIIKANVEVSPFHANAHPFHAKSRFFVRTHTPFMRNLAFSCERTILSCEVSLLRATAHPFHAKFHFFVRTHTPFMRNFTFSCERKPLPCEVYFFHSFAQKSRGVKSPAFLLNPFSYSLNWKSD